MSEPTNATPTRQNDESSVDDTAELPESFDRRAATRVRPYTLFEAPAAVKRLFSRFPLRSEPAETRPASSIPAASSSSSSSTRQTLPSGEQSSLHLELWLRASGESGYDSRVPSHDLESLKWQTFALARGVQFGVRRAYPEAAPDGRLPFFVASSSGSSQAQDSQRPAKKSGNNSGGNTGRSTIIRQREIETFIRLRERKIRPDSEERRQTTLEKLGLALIERQLRPAWLWALYMAQSNFKAIVRPAYVDSITESAIARITLEREIRTTVANELSAWVSGPELISGTMAMNKNGASTGTLAQELNWRAAAALGQLVAMLDGHQFFSLSDRPGLLDAELFAYTHLLTAHNFGKGVGWVDDALAQEVTAKAELVRHHDAVFAFCFSR